MDVCTKKKPNCTSAVKPITLRKGEKQKKRRKPLILQYRVVYMHISWFIHISHTIVRTLRPKPLQKGLSSKASEKITHRLKVCSRAATRLHHVPKARSSPIIHSFPVSLGAAGYRVLQRWRYSKLSTFTFHMGLMMFSLQMCELPPGSSKCQEEKLSERIYNRLCGGAPWSSLKTSLVKYDDEVKLLRWLKRLKQPISIHNINHCRRKRKSPFISLPTI